MNQHRASALRQGRQIQADQLDMLFLERGRAVPLPHPLPHADGREPARPNEMTSALGEAPRPIRRQLNNCLSIEQFRAHIYTQ